MTQQYIEKNDNFENKEVKELQIKYRSRKFRLPKENITSSETAFLILKELYEGEPYEVFYVLVMDNHNNVKGFIKHSEGETNQAQVYIRKLFQGVLLSGASSILVAHNHPSGNLKPSTEDIAITEKIKKAAKLLNIRLLDHLVVGNNDFMSFKGEGLL